MVRVCIPGAAFVILCACSSSPPPEPSIGIAFAGPASLNLHKDVDLKSETVTIAHHGDKLDIVAQRRRWYKVRTSKGIEGWTSDRELLDPGQMRRIAALAKETAGLPSQGVATSLAALNVHTEPSRQSTSFIQVEENEQFDIIARRVVARTPPPKRELVPPKPKIAKKKVSREKKGSIPPPPSPAPPAPPSDWVDLSRERGQAPVEEETNPAPHDDWTLIRTSNGQSGWVLTSATYLKIPDEVAQYAEGHRITSYFSLGKIRDGDLQKDIWLWTTAETLGEDHDFDSYRVFTWSLRHHRYETAYIQRRVQGFFPVLTGKGGDFSVCLEAPDGSRIRKQYEMIGNAVRPTGQRPCPKTADPEIASRDLATTAATSPAAEGIATRIKNKLHALFRK